MVGRPTGVVGFEKDLESIMFSVLLLIMVANMFGYAPTSASEASKVKGQARRVLFNQDRWIVCSNYGDITWGVATPSKPPFQT